MAAESSPVQPASAEGDGRRSIISGGNPPFTWLRCFSSCFWGVAGPLRKAEPQKLEAGTAKPEEDDADNNNDGNVRVSLLMAGGRFSSDGNHNGVSLTCQQES